jgi:hypothetical protein
MTQNNKLGKGARNEIWRFGTSGSIDAFRHYHTGGGIRGMAF